MAFAPYMYQNSMEVECHNFVYQRNKQIYLLNT